MRIAVGTIEVTHKEGWIPAILHALVGPEALFAPKVGSNAEFRFRAGQCVSTVEITGLHRHIPTSQVVEEYFSRVRTITRLAT